MKFICEYREFDDNVNLPSVKDNVSNVQLDNKNKILKYLKSGRALFVTSIQIIDVFSGRRTNIELCTYTDETFTWTSEEVYYFENYNMKLSDEFIKSIR